MKTYLQQILDKMVIDNILHERGSGVSRTYLIPEDPDKSLFLIRKVFRTTQIITC